MSVSSSSSPPDPARGSGPERGYLWADDLVETSPAELRAHRRKRIAIRAGAALLACAVVAGIAGMVYSALDHRPDVVVVEGFAPHDKDLRDYLIPTPAGAERPADPIPEPTRPGQAQPPTPPERLVPGDRRLSRESAADVTGDDDYLRRHKYARGYERRWIQKDGIGVSVLLLRFRGAKNAALYARDIFDLYKVNDEYRDTEVPAVPQGRSLLSTAPVRDTDGTWFSLSAAAAGDVVVIVVAEDGKPLATAQITETLLAEQYARLK
ncbi:hypothetical protein AB0M36_31705 [Actinoplanes sp. NPDC051346]|uniref:hypothetical protein n=1 Tax=Actinoplanes sp. NPDC051346 TaxID=3155048 RepID=UPI003447CDFE